MNGHAAIAGTSEAFRGWLELAFGQSRDAAVRSTRVTTAALDSPRVSDGRNQVNLFLYSASVNGSMRNTDLPAGRVPVDAQAPALPLDLYYFLTVYPMDNKEMTAHRVLGFAMRAIQEQPFIGPVELATVLDDSALRGVLRRFRLTPHALPGEELSRWWSTFQSAYRLSVAYQASPVFLERDEAIPAALPVLSRGLAVRPAPGSLYPQLSSAVPHNGMTAVSLNGALDLTGANLDGDAVEAVFSHRLWTAVIPLSAEPRGATAKIVVIPNVPAQWHAGIYTVHLRVIRGTHTFTTAAAAFGLAPEVTLAADTPRPLRPNALGRISLRLTVRPDVVPEQNVRLLFGGQEVPPADGGTRTALTFEFEAPPDGRYFVRLRVDGVESEIIDPASNPLSFDGRFEVEVRR